MQTEEGPAIAPANGNGLTVTGCIAIAEPQLLETVKVIVSTPAVTPVTTPPVTKALAFVAPHTPPGARSVNVMEAPTHRLLPPSIVPAVRNAPTVIIFVVDEVPQTLTTV
jgi:hypothetical protein